jgi:hypothetical protein
MRRNTRFAILAAVALMILALLPAGAVAQPYHGHGPGPGYRYPGHVSVGFGWGWGYPYWGAYYWGGYPWYPYGWGGYYGGWYYDDSAEVRLQVTPKDAQVYLDGYYAGIVDDFDGMFQRLRMEPGDHQLVLYLKGYKTVQQDVRVRPNASSKIEYKMQPLGPGEANEPPPRPAVRPAPEPSRPVTQAVPGYPAERPAPAVGAQGFGSLVLRVQPAGAEVLIDGERWQGPEGQERLVVQLAAGAHRVEIKKDGYVTFTSEVRVGSGETTPLNVSLPRGQ